MMNKLLLGLMLMMHSMVQAESVYRTDSAHAAANAEASQTFIGVQRNREVQAIAKAENIEIQRPMRALSYGRVGQTIRVFDPNTQVIHQALVVSNEVVQLQWKGLTSQ